MESIGFIGLGIMGKPMALNLIRAGYVLTVYDINPEPLEELKKAGAMIAASGKEVARNNAILITMLPNSPHVKAAVFGENGIFEGIRRDAILIDMSSIAPAASKEIAEGLAKKGAHMLDAPVSGGEPKAINGSLAIMVGGRKDIFDKVYDILMVMGASAVLCGDIGAGNTTKLANQIIVAANIAALGEALVLGKKAGVDPGEIVKAIRGGLAGSTVMDAKGPMMTAGNFTPGFRIALHIKDLNNVLETGHEYGAPLPLTSTVMEMMQWLKAEGLDALDHSALVKYYENLAGVSVSEQ
ncbi:MAG: 2-hydroxy-3-oxopropionate reductase [Clostridiales bacterium]|nr:2-hydroxy-3-oxopropionate reductase [Clostridiales bacterium]